VLLEAYKAMSDQVKSVEDMDSLTMDIVEEHLDQNQKEEAEREFAQEIAPPQPFPLPFGIQIGNQMIRPPFPVLEILRKAP
jgi:hypothetical protein